MINILEIELFDLEKTMECGQCFHYDKLGHYKYRVYGYNSVCIVEQVGNKLFLDSEDLSYWKTYFALDMDYKSIIKYLIDFGIEHNDEFILKAIEVGKGVRILRQPFFETCCSYILSQRNNIPRIRKMIFDLSHKYSTKSVEISTDSEYNGSYFCFPMVSDLKKCSEEDFKKLGFGYRAEYLKLFVDNWDNIFDKVKFDYNSDFELFKSRKGIGDKVANCICLYGFGEYNAFPVDTWMQKIIKEEYIEKGKELKLPEKYAGILQQFMFYTKRMELGK